MTWSLLRNGIMRFSALGFRSDIRIEFQAPVVYRQTVIEFFYFLIPGCSVETCRRIFRCFISIVEESSSDIESLQYLYTYIVPAVYNWVITHRHVEGWRDRVRDEVILQRTATFLRKTVTSLTRQNQRYRRYFLFMPPVADPDGVRKKA